MKKLTTSIFFIVYLLSGSCSVLAQEAGTALISVTYDFVHVNDTNNREKPIKEEMILYLGENGSVYKSLTKELRLKEMQEKMLETLGPEKKEHKNEQYQFLRSRHDERRDVPIPSSGKTDHIVQIGLKGLLDRAYFS